MNPRLKELFSNTLIFTIANFSSKILVFLMVPLYTAVLSTEEYGVSDMVVTICSLMLPVLTLSISNAVLRFCFLEGYKKEDVFAIGHRVIIRGTAISLLITIGLFALNVFPQLGLYIWFVPAQFLFNSYSTFLSCYSRGIGKVKLSAIAGVSSTFTIVILNLILLLLFKWGIMGYMFSYLAGSVVSVIVMWLNLPTKKTSGTELKSDLGKQMIKFSLPLIPNDLSWWALDSFNRFFIISTLGISAVGVYSASAKIPAILTALCGIFSQAWTLSALNGYGTEDNTGFICAVHKKMFAILTIVTAIFIIFSKPMALMLLQGEFSSCWYMIPYLFVSVFMGAMVGFYGAIYSAERKNEIQFLSTLGGSVVSILLMIILLQKYGIVVAAISNMIGYIIIWYIRKLGIKKFIDIGMSTSYCCLQLALLLLLSVTVSFSLWLIAGFLLFSIFIVNKNEIFSTASYLKDMLVSYKIKKRHG